MTPFPLLGTEDPNRHWCMALGQSNQTETSSTDSGTAEGAVVYRCLSGTATPGPLADPLISTTAPEYSSWPAYLRARYALGELSGLITCAYGGTALRPDPESEAIDGSPARWDPTAGRALLNAGWPGFTGVAGDLYAGAVYHWRSIGSPRLRFVSWLQGEKEAGRGANRGRSYETIYADYYESLYALVTAIREDLGCPTLIDPITLAEYYADPATTAVAQPVHDAAIAVAAAHPHAYLGANWDDLTLTGSGNHCEDVETLGTRRSAAVTAAGL